MSEFDFEAAANRLFGGSTPSSAPSNTQGIAQPATDEQSMAERLFGKPAAPRQANTEQRDDRPMSELTEAEQAQRLHRGSDPMLTFANASLKIQNAAMEDSLAAPEDAKAIAAEWAGEFAQHQLSDNDSVGLVDLGRSVLSNPPSEQTLAGWRQDAMTLLKTEYTPAGANAALQAAREYVANTPGLTEKIDAWGLGDHPLVVKICAERGRAMRSKG